MAQAAFVATLLVAGGAHGEAEPVSLDVVREAGQREDVSYEVSISTMDFQAPLRGRVRSKSFGFEEAFQERVMAAEDGEATEISRTYRTYVSRRSSPETSKTKRRRAWEKRNPKLKNETVLFKVEKGRLVSGKRAPKGTAHVVKQVGARCRWEPLLPTKPVVAGTVAGLWTLDKKAANALLPTDVVGKITSCLFTCMYKEDVVHKGHRSARIEIVLIVTTVPWKGARLSLMCTGEMFYRFDAKRIVDLKITGTTSLKDGKEHLLGRTRIEMSLRPLSQVKILPPTD